MLIRRKIFRCPDTRVGSVFTNVDSVAFKEPGAAETIFLAEFYDLTIETGILLFEAVDLDFHEFDMDAGVQLFDPPTSIITMLRIS
jgi:hypothetical protein